MRGRWSSWIGLAGACALAVAGCDEGESAGAGAAADDAPKPDALEGLVVHTDLLDRAHLADVEHHGLFVDLGTPAQGKYTAGDWDSGFGTRGRDGDRTFARVGQRGRLYFHLDGPSDLTVTLSLRPRGTGTLTPYANGTALQSLRFEESGGWQDVTFPVPVGETRAGENQLMLIFGGTTPVAGEDVSVELASARIATGAGETPAGFEPPTWDGLVGEATVGGEARRALTVGRPSTVSWYVEVPPAAKLGLSAGAVGAEGGEVTVAVRPEGGAEQIVARGTLGQGWTDLTADLKGFAGKVVRVAVRTDPATGGAAGEIALASAGIYRAPVEPAGDREKPKHLVVLLVDTLRADKLSPFDEGTRVRTPVIDRIASEGTTFLQAQSPAPWTKPSVASILTGLHPMTHGAKTQAAVVPGSAVFLGEHLKAQGWATAGFIGNGYVSDKFGFDQGWDRYRNFIREGANTDASNIFQEAGDWAAAHKDEPFFLYVHTIDPHVPYDPPADFLKLYDDRDGYDGVVKARSTGDLLAKAKKNPPQVTFDASDRKRLEALHDGEITQHDVELGKFVDRLNRLGIWEDTLFVFVSDHGEEFDDHGSWGHGHSIYQELLRVPLVMRYRGGVPQGRRVASAVGTVDIAPTVLEVLGMPPLPDAEGRSLVPLFADDHPPGVVNVGMSEWGEERRVLTTRAWKLVLRGNLTTAMFDLASDPGEQQQKDVGDFPIAARFTRILQGQYLAATDRRSWMSAEQGASRRLDGGEADMDPATCEQLKQLGYVDAETDCNAM